MGRKKSARALRSAALARRRMASVSKFATKSQVAKRVGVTATAVDHWVSGRAGMSAQSAGIVLAMIRECRGNGSDPPLSLASDAESNGACAQPKLRDGNLGALVELAGDLSARDKIQLARVLLDSAVLLEVE